MGDEFTASAEMLAVESTTAARRDEEKHLQPHSGDELPAFIFLDSDELLGYLTRAIGHCRIQILVCALQKLHMSCRLLAAAALGKEPPLRLVHRHGHFSLL